MENNAGQGSEGSELLIQGEESVEFKGEGPKEHSANPSWKGFFMKETFQLVFSWILLFVFLIALMVAAIHVNKGIWRTIPWPFGLLIFAISFRKVWPEEQYAFVLTSMAAGNVCATIGSLVYQLVF